MYNTLTLYDIVSPDQVGQGKKITFQATSSSPRIVIEFYDNYARYNGSVWNFSTRTTKDGHFVLLLEQGEKPARLRAVPT